MARIPADLIKELRRRTGASIADCRRALEATLGDVRQAVRLLRLESLTVAGRRARLTGPNGIVATHVQEDGSAGALVEMSFESKRTARSDRFQAFLAPLAALVATEPLSSVDQLLEQPFPGTGGTVMEGLGDLVLRSGEALGIRRFARLPARRSGLVAGYAHGPGPLGRLGVLVEVGGARDEAAARLARELTLQIVFDRPAYLRRDDVPAERLAFERDVIRRKLLRGGEGGSLDALAEEVLRNSFFRSAVLLDQPWVRDLRRTVGDLVAECSEASGHALQVRRFILLPVGGPVEEAALP